MIKFVVFSSVLLSLVLFKNVSSLPISIQRFGYTTYSGITIAINSRVEENELIIEKIQEIFEEGSRVLYKSTRNRAFFKEVIISIPNTWKPKPHYENVTGDLFAEAHIRVDLENPQYGDEPYTLQPGGCGENGLYIHYTPNYILNPVSQFAFRTNEIPGHRLVQEWSRFRYGVFEEYGYPGHDKYKTLYFDNLKGRVLPTGCTREIEGSYDYSDPICKAAITEGDTNLKELLNCTVIPQESETETASIMYTASLPDVVHFCQTDDNQDGTLHNSEAPNKQNDFCEGRSTWDVVLSHSDLKTAELGDDKQNTKPKFRIIRTVSQENRFVWVLDNSYSMRGKPFELLAQATSRCLMDEQCVMPNDEIGLVSFNSEPTILSELVKVENETQRASLVSLIPKSAARNGHTAIGRALFKAVDVLTYDNKTAEGGVIILVTDGKEVLGPKISQVLPWLAKNKVRVSAVAFGQKADDNLEMLTTSTGGKLYLFNNLNGSTYSESASPSELYHTFFEAATTQTDVTIKPVTIVGNELVEPFLPYFVREFNIEKVLGKDTTVVIQSIDMDNIELKIIRPNESEVTRNSPEVEKVTDNGIKFKFPMAESGTWKVFVKPILEPLTLTVRSSPSDSNDVPVRIKSWTGDFEVTFPESLTIYAEVKKDYAPITNAKVQATVMRPNGSLVNVELKDDGATPDLEQGDGIYSAYFSNFSGNGRYGLTAKVLNDGQAKLKFSKQRIKRSSNSNENSIAQESVEEFERFIDAGVFKVRNYRQLKIDEIPPAKVTDLQVTEKARFSTNEFVVELRWTSPGDDYNTGNASSLQLRYTTTGVSKLRTSFEDCDIINTSSVLSGQLVPLPSGQKQSVVIRVLLEASEFQNITTLDFALVVKDEANNTSSLSNIVRAYFEAVKLDTNPRLGQVYLVHHESHILLASLISFLIYFLTISIILVISFLLIQKSREFQLPTYRRIKVNAETQL